MKKSLSTIPSILAECCKKFAKKTALFLNNGSKISYNDMMWDISRTSQVLRDQGISKNSRVALFMTDNPQSIETFLAVTHMGAIAIILRYDYSSAQISEILTTEKPDAVFLSENKLEVIPAGLKMTVLEMADNKILEKVERPASESVYTISDTDIAVISFTLAPNGELTKKVYTHKELAEGTKAAKKLSKNKASQSNPLNSIIGFTKTNIFPVLNGIGTSCKDFVTSLKNNQKKTISDI